MRKRNVREAETSDVYIIAGFPDISRYINPRLYWRAGMAAASIERRLVERVMGSLD
jgi:hypothetical protein